MTEQTQTPKIKMALCALDKDIQNALTSCPRIVTVDPLVELVECCASDLGDFKNTTFDALDKLPTELVDRKICDDKINIDTGRRQLLPYITYVKNADSKTYVFMYKRGTAGDEGRLHNLYSIGVGGHVEGDNKDGKLLDTLVSNMHQETLEEIGVDLDNRSFIQALLNSMFILDSRKATEIVHCGISVFMSMDPSLKMVFEEGCLVESQWISLDDLKEKIADGAIKLEAWSELVLTYRM